MSVVDDIEKNVKDGIENEKLDNNFFKIFVFSIATLGIYLILIVYERCMILTNFANRKIEFFNLYTDYLKEKYSYDDEEKYYLKKKIMYYKDSSKPLFKFFIVSCVIFLVFIIFSIILYKLGINISSYNIDFEVIPDILFDLLIVDHINFLASVIAFIFMMSFLFLMVYIDRTINYWDNIQKIDKEVFNIINELSVKYGIIESYEKYQAIGWFGKNKYIILKIFITLGIYLLYLDIRLFGEAEKVIEKSHKIESELVSGIISKENNGSVK